ncbi:Tc5 transposase DNA-binding domain-containing protein [Hirsutella rhossiliensis]
MIPSTSHLSAVQKWIDSKTNLPIFQRNIPQNLEERTVAGAELYKEGFYRTIRAAAQALDVPYKRLWSRVQGHQPVQQNGGLNKLFSPSEEREILCWSHRRITQGHHITSRTLRQHANAILQAKGEKPTISTTWVKNFIKRNKKLFHAKKAASRDAKRKAMQDRVRVEAFFRDWREFLIRRRIDYRASQRLEF